jgi:hypothetical protein
MALLAGVPDYRWQDTVRPGAMDKAHAAIAALEGTATADVAESLAQFRRRAMWFDRGEVTVYTQYVGYARAEAQAAVDFLNDRFGWAASPPSPVDRSDVGTEGAAHQIRYKGSAAEGEWAARLLAAELTCEVDPGEACRSLTFAGPLPTFELIAEPSIPEGQIEVWIAR